MTLRLTDEADDALTRLAAAQGVSKNEAALRAILEDERRVSRAAVIEAALDDTVKRYAQTLERLGE